MEENSSKKVFLSVLGVAILMVAVVGISFAVFSYTSNNTEVNKITTGQVTMTYAESTSGVKLVDALPISDEAGMAYGLGTGSASPALKEGEVAYFDFDVNVSATGTITIPYEINVTKATLTAGKTQLPDGSVKIYLTKKSNDTETAVSGYPKLMSDVITAGNKSTLRTSEDAYKLHDETVTFTTGTGSGNANTSYRLRIWIDSAVDTNTLTGKEEYAIKVNVDSVK